MAAASLGKRSSGETSKERVRRQEPSAQCSDIVEGDRIQLNKSRDNKLSPNFQPIPYKVVEKKGNAILIEDEVWNTKLRNTDHSLFSQALALKPLKPKEETKQRTCLLEES